MAELIGEGRVRVRGLKVPRARIAIAIVGEKIAEHELVAGVELVVEAGDDDVAIERRSRVCAEIAGARDGRGAVRLRPEGKHRLRHRVEAGDRNYITRKRLPRGSLGA